jgi:hypothetical protein
MNDDPRDISLSQLRAGTIYHEWRQSLSYEPQTYGSVAKSLEGAIIRANDEIANPVIRFMVVQRFQMMITRLSEFTPSDTMDVADIGEDPNRGVEHNRVCCTCGRPIADFETCYPLNSSGQLLKCVDCHIK